MSQYTEEQQEIIDHIITNDGIFTVDAKAGTGKSFVAVQLVRHLNPKQGFYFAFNKAIVEDIKPKLPNCMDVQTLHALAYKYVKPAKGIGDLTYLDIQEKLLYPTKKKIIDTIDDFCRSDSTDPEEYFDEVKLSDKLKPFAFKYITEMFDGKRTMTFNSMLKYLHMLLDQSIISIEYDLVILDECNDITAVGLEIFKLIKSPKKIALGDSAQKIYEFMNLVSAFDLLKVDKEFSLTHSFRVADNIAPKIEKFGKRYIDHSFKFTGTPTPIYDGKVAYITATNAKIIQRISWCIANNLGFTLLRPVSEIFASLLAVHTANRGKEVKHRRYKFLEKEYANSQHSEHSNFFTYLLEEVDDKEIHVAVRTLKNFKKKNINVFDLLKKTKATKPDPNRIICTAYTSKGLEMETVNIEDDLNNYLDRALTKGKTKEKETAVMVYYVAVSRARCTLNNAILLEE